MTEARIDETLLASLIDNWPFLVVKQYKILNSQDEQIKATLQKELNSVLNTIDIQDGVKWTGNFKEDLLAIINKKIYNSSTYTIKDGQIYIVDGMKKEWVNYMTSPAAATLFKRVGEILAQQQRDASDNAAYQQLRKDRAIDQENKLKQKIIDNSPKPATAPEMRPSSLNKLSTI